MPSPKKYKIILGVSGGIAAYKSAELARLFIKAGHEVRVVMSANAEKFIGALTFHSLTGNEVLRSLQEGASDLSATSHIDLARWGDLFLLAPATANILAKARGGIADDALSTELLAFQGPVLFAPAMNTRMWDAPATRENYALLAARGFHFVGPDSGDLACGEQGEGKMTEPLKIFEAALNLLAEETLPLKGKTVLVTSGPTRSYLDPIRYLSNRSSGKMGHAIALAAESAGAHVILVTGPVEERFAQLRRGKVKKVETGAEMLAASLAEIDKADLVVAAAAVADFVPTQVEEKKIRREGKLALDLTASVDVLAELAKRKKPGQRFIGFAAETGEGAEERKKAYEKLERKNLDLLAFNNVARKDIGFDVDDNEILLFSRTSRIKPAEKENKNAENKVENKTENGIVEKKLAKKDKYQIAKEILQEALRDEGQN